MKDSIKRFAGRAAAVVSALSFAMSTLSFPSFSASAAVNIQLDSLTVRGLIGDTLQGYYVDSSRNYKACEFTFNSYQTMSDRYFTPTGSYASGTQILLLYTTPLPADIGQDLTQQDAIISVDLGLHLDNVTHFEMIFGGGLDGYFTTSAYSALNTYNYVLSTAPALPDRSITTGDGFRTSLAYNPYNNQRGGFYGMSGAGGYSALYYKMDSPTAGSVSIDTVQCSCLALGSSLHFVITLPYVNSDVEIPSNISDLFPASGKASGTVSENSSGGYDVDYDLSIDLPDYSSQLDTIANPSLSAEQEGALSGLDSAGEALGGSVDDYDDIVDDIDSYEWEIDGDSFALDTIDGDLPDLTPPTDVVDGVNDLWELLELDRSAPIILRYMPILILFMFGSYVIFGKWI